MNQMTLDLARTVIDERVREAQARRAHRHVLATRHSHDQPGQPPRPRQPRAWRPLHALTRHSLQRHHTN
jgi:hypothetical protein